MNLVVFKCPNCFTEYEIDAKYESVLKDKKDCKFCVRKDPNIPTTAEMDGLLTQEDMRNRHSVMFQCRSCKKWTRHDNWITGQNNKHKPCECGVTNYDQTSIKSVRSYNPLTDNKRKPK